MPLLELKNLHSLHSVLGEFSDKATQSEIEQLEGAINSAADQAAQGNGVHSRIRELLNRLHIGGAEELDSQATVLENKSKAKASEGQHGKAWGLNNNGDEIRAQIYPFLEWHDKIMSAINEAIESIPGLTVIVEKLSEAVSIFVFSLMAPFLMPIIQQVKVELSTGSSEVIGSSKNLQFIVFSDHQSSNPTHSMLSKDHFTNMYLFLNLMEVGTLADKNASLNEPAGKIASEVIKFVVPMLMAAWDNPHTDVEHTINEIVGVFHHPAFADGSDGRGGIEGRQKMFGVVRQWWEEKDESEREFLRHALSREGVEQGKNHKEGQHDSGHGCGKPIHRVKPKKDGGEFGIAEDMGKAMGSALEEAFLSGGQGGGGSSSGFGGLLGGIAGAAFGGYMAGQMNDGGGGGGGSRSSGFEEVRERGSGGSRVQERGMERGVERSYEQGSGGSRYEERSYEKPVAHGDTAAYLRSHAYGTGEGRGYYEESTVEGSGSHRTPVYESHSTAEYGVARSMPGAFEERESYREGSNTTGSYGQGSHSSSRHVQSTRTGGYTAEAHHVSYTSQQSSSHGKYSSHETRVEHHGHGGRGEGEHRQKVYQEYSGDEQGGGYYTERRYIKHYSGEEKTEHSRYKKSGSGDDDKHRRRGSGDEGETRHRRRGSGDEEEEEEEEEDEYERKKREKKERKRREKEHARHRRSSGSGDEYYGSGDE